MTQEEKAKSYDKALERAKNLHGKYCINNVLESLFPELKEPEDESIRKEIISIIKSYRENCITEGNHRFENCIAWLEKQSKEEYALKSFKDEDVRKFMQYIEKEAKAYEFNLPNRGYDIYAFAKDILYWLEKQGETDGSIKWHNVLEEPEEMRELLCEWDSDDATWHEVAFYHSYNKTFWDGERQVENVTKWCYIDELFEKQGEIDNCPLEYSTNTVITDSKKNLGKIKFKVGDWVVQENIGVYKVIEVCESWYEVIDIEDNHYSIGFDKEYMCHLWSIKDAKDGDVLAVDNMPFIYNGSKNEVTVGAYCGFNVKHKFSFAYNYVINRNITPATKEQRDLLFQKMKEAGYEWDAEKKELKKIEHKPTDKVEPKFKVGDWVVDKNGIVKQILSYKDGIYKHTYGYSGKIFEDEWRIWTIQDAKDGDVLHSSAHNLIWIYKDNQHYHACMNMNYVKENFSTCGFIVIPTDVCPATKDEQTILFAKMKEEGYEWAEEKKKLKIIDFSKHLEYNPDAPSIIEQKLAWSYEDEANLNNIIWLCNNCINGSETTWIPSQATRIKSLIETIKQRGLPQQKPTEWSEGDDAYKLFAISAVEDYYDEKNPLHKDLVDWLKSLKDRCTWKTSDLPHWKKSSLPNDDTTGFNSDYFCHKGYYINYKELFEKLPKED